MIDQMKKKILFVVPSLGMGGMERVLVNYTNLFSNRGYDVTVYNLTSDDETIIRHMNKGVHYFPQYSPVKNIAKSSLKDIVHGNFRMRSWRTWIAEQSPEQLHKRYIKDSFDVEVAFFGMESIKIVAGAPDGVLKLGWFHGEQKENDYAPLKTKEEAVELIARLDKIVCVSERAAETVTRVYQRQDGLYVINNPNDTKMIRQLSMYKTDVPEKRCFTFVNASRFDDKQKGYSRMLRVCKRLVDEGLNFDFWMVGDGIDFHTIQQKTIELQLDNILFLGKQANPYKYIKNADMYVCFSYSEGFSMVMMETIILATPMLSTDVPGAKEMLDGGKYGMIVPNNETGLYEGLKKILSEPDIYSRYRKMAFERKDYLSEDAIMDRVEDLIYSHV